MGEAIYYSSPKFDFLLRDTVSIFAEDHSGRLIRISKHKLKELIAEAHKEIDTSLNSG